MTHPTLSDTQNVHIASGYDVVLVRQNVRQMARKAGFCLTSQARMTAVVSEIARAALERRWNADFTLRLFSHRGKSTLEVTCHSRDMQRDGEYVAHLRHEVEGLAGNTEMTFQHYTGHLTLRFCAQS